jgi:hypothetical protein
MAELNHDINTCEALQDIKLGGERYILAEDGGSMRPYVIFRLSGQTAFGWNDCRAVHDSSDYIAAMREFTRRINAQLDLLDLDRVYGPPANFTLREDDCVPGGMDSNLTGKVVAIKEGSLAHEYRRGSCQLMLVIGGFGASPNASGRAVYCTELDTGKNSRWGREQILGVVRPDRIPEWAKEKLAEMEKAGKAVQPEKPSVMAQLREARDKPAPTKPKNTQIKDKGGLEL